MEQNDVDEDDYIDTSNKEESEDSLPPSIGHGVIWIEENSGCNFQDALSIAEEFIDDNFQSKPSVVCLFGAGVSKIEFLKVYKDFDIKSRAAIYFNGAEADIICYKVGEDLQFIQNCSRARKLLILITDRNSKAKIVELLQKATLGKNPSLHKSEGEYNHDMIHILNGTKYYLVPSKSRGP